VEASLLQAADAEMVPAQSVMAAAAEIFAKRFMSESPVLRRQEQAGLHCKIDNVPSQKIVPPTESHHRGNSGEAMSI
jgi:hypothetical protein